MKRAIHTIQLVILVFAVSGFTTTTSLSQNPLIEHQLHRRLKIQRECLLASGAESWDKVKAGNEKWFRDAPYQLYDKEEGSNSWRPSGWIKPGTELTIERVLYRRSFETDYIDTYGTLYLEGREIHFWYSWRSLSRDVALKRAPWEGDDVPKMRILKKL